MFKDDEQIIKHKGIQLGKGMWDVDGWKIFDSRTRVPKVYGKYKILGDGNLKWDDGDVWTKVDKRAKVSAKVTCGGSLLAREAARCCRMRTCRPHNEESNGWMNGWIEWMDGG